ncbi:MAG: DUF5316 domain-containing protein [Clostridiaceae bacterium]
MSVSVLIGIILNDWALTVKISGAIGLICIVVAGIASGSFVSGDRYRANDSLDTEEDRTRKNKISVLAILIALPNIIVTVILLFVLNKG